MTKDISEFHKLSTTEKLDEIYVSLTNHLSKHKIIDSIIIASFLCLIALILKLIFGISIG